MKLYIAFNKNYLQIFKIIHKSFNDIKEVDSHYTDIMEMFGTPKAFATKTLYKSFAQDLDQQILDRLKAKDQGVFLELKFFKHAGYGHVVSRLLEEEKPVFWKNIQSLCQCSAMIQACGSQLDQMENIATNFMKKNPKLSPQEYHKTLFQEMLSGGDLSKQLLQTFQQKGSIQNIMKNVGNIIRTGDDEQDAELTKLFSHLQVSSEEDENFESNVLEALQENIY